MADATVAEVMTAARAHLNDPDAENFSDTKLAPHFAVAYRRLFDELVNRNLPLSRRTVYYTLPAYTVRLTPSEAGISNFGELTANGLEERASSTSYNISAATTATPVVITAAGHTFTDYTDVVVWGIAGLSGGNGRWYCTVAGNDLTLLGSVGSGTYTTGGKVASSTEEFTELAYQPDLDYRSPTDKLSFYDWREDAWYFAGATSARQLRITYLQSGAAPTSGSIGIDNAKDFLAAYTAALAGFPQDRVDEGHRLMRLCLGDPMHAEPGLLHMLVNPMVKQQQQAGYQMPRYRPQGALERGRRLAPYIRV